MWVPCNLSSVLLCKHLVMQSPLTVLHRIISMVSVSLSSFLQGWFKLKRFTGTDYNNNNKVCKIFFIGTVSLEHNYKDCWIIYDSPSHENIFQLPSGNTSETKPTFQQVWLDFKPQGNISSSSLVSLFSSTWLHRQITLQGNPKQKVRVA